MKGGLLGVLQMGNPWRIRFGTPQVRDRWCTALLRTP